MRKDGPERASDASTAPATVSGSGLSLPLMGFHWEGEGQAMIRESGDRPCRVKQGLSGVTAIGEDDELDPNFRTLDRAGANAVRGLGWPDAGVRRRLCAKPRAARCSA